MPVERIQAASGGMNTEASPDYVQNAQAPLIENLLTGRPGKLVMRGSFTTGINVNASSAHSVQAFWAYDDAALLKTNNGTVDKSWFIDLTGSMSKTDATATLVESPSSSVHARYGANVYGAITDAVNPQLGKWDGTFAAIVPQANAPFGFTDIQVYAQRLFVLGGSVPGTTTPLKSRTLYYTDPAATFATVTGLTGVAATDIITATAHGYANGTQITFPTITGGAGLTANIVYYVITATTNTFQVALTAGGAAVDFTTAITAGTVARADWFDDVSGLTNELDYDGDDTPVGLAGCGRFMAIIGTRSINILTGTGSSSFAVRNLTRSWGCIDIKSIVEVDDGFYFASDRGLAFCDGASVALVSGDVNAAVLLPNEVYTAAVFGHGYLALNQTEYTWLYHLETKTWSRLTSAAFPATVPSSVHRSLSYPLVWDGVALWRGENITRWAVGGGSDSGAGVSAVSIPAKWSTRIARLASPTNTAILKRYIVDAALSADTSARWTLTLRNEDGTTTTSLAEALSGADNRRRRTQVEAYLETTSLYLDLVYQALVGTPSLGIAELYDCWLDFDPGRNAPSF